MISGVSWSSMKVMRSRKQLALLQALNLDDVGARRNLQRRNRDVEVAMLLLQARKLCPQLAFFLFCHRRLGRAVVPPRAPLAWAPLGHGLGPVSRYGLSRFGRRPTSPQGRRLGFLPPACPWFAELPGRPVGPGRASRTAAPRCRRWKASNPARCRQSPILSCPAC